jgi:hypothetical protein
LETTNCDSGVMDPEIDEKTFCAIVCSCKKVKEGLVINMWRVTVMHDNRLQIYQDGGYVIGIPWESKGFQGCDRERLLGD